MDFAIYRAVLTFTKGRAYVKCGPNTYMQISGRPLTVSSYVDRMNWNGIQWENIVTGEQIWNCALVARFNGIIAE